MKNLNFKSLISTPARVTSYCALVVTSILFSFPGLIHLVLLVALIDETIMTTKLYEKLDELEKEAEDLLRSQEILDKVRASWRVEEKDLCE